MTAATTTMPACLHQFDGRLYAKVNLNDYLRFQPVEESAIKLAELHFHKESDGWYRGQAWEFLQHFGDLIGWGRNPVNMNIEIQVSRE